MSARVAWRKNDFEYNFSKNLYRVLNGANKYIFIYTYVYVYVYVYIYRPRAFQIAMVVNYLPPFIIKHHRRFVHVEKKVLCRFLIIVALFIYLFIFSNLFIFFIVSEGYVGLFIECF